MPIRGISYWAKIFSGTLGSRDAFFNVRDFGAAGNGVTDDREAINDLANTTLSNGGTIIFPVGTYLIGAAITFNTNIELVFLNNSQLTVSTGITVTINGTIDAGRFRIFSGNGTVVINGNNTIFPEWWGAVTVLSDRNGILTDNPTTDGITDAQRTLNTTAMQNALNQQGEVLLAGNRKYYLNNPLLLKAHTCIRGQSRTVLIWKYQAGSDTVLYDKCGFTQYRLGTSSSTNEYLIISNLYDFKIHDLIIVGPASGNGSTQLLGTCNVTNGSNIITNTSNNFASVLSEGSFIQVGAAHLTVISVDDVANTITCAENYPGLTATDISDSDLAGNPRNAFRRNGSHVRGNDAFVFGARADTYGTHTGGNGSSTLIDSTKTFTGLGLITGSTDNIENLTTSAIGQITSVVNNTTLNWGTVTSGFRTTWNTGDRYRIRQGAQLFGAYPFKNVIIHNWQGIGIHVVGSVFSLTIDGIFFRAMHDAIFIGNNEFHGSGGACTGIKVENCVFTDITNDCFFVASGTDAPSFGPGNTTENTPGHYTHWEGTTGNPIQHGFCTGNRNEGGGGVSLLLSFGHFWRNVWGSVFINAQSSNRIFLVQQCRLNNIQVLDAENSALTAVFEDTAGGCENNSISITYLSDNPERDSYGSSDGNGSIRSNINIYANEGFTSFNRVASLSSSTPSGVENQGSYEINTSSNDVIIYLPGSFQAWNSKYRFLLETGSSFDPSIANVARIFDRRSSTTGTGSSSLIDNHFVSITAFTTVNGTVWSNDGGVFTDETTDAIDGDTNDITILPSTPAAEDAFYVGLDRPFTSISFTLGTNGVLGPLTITIDWEYYNGTQWTVLLYNDQTSNFTTSGPVQWTQPSDWVQVSVSGISRFYVRARVISANGQPWGTTPLGSFLLVLYAAQIVLRREGDFVEVQPKNFFASTEVYPALTAFYKRAYGRDGWRITTRRLTNRAIIPIGSSSVTVYDPNVYQHTNFHLEPVDAASARVFGSAQRPYISGTIIDGTSVTFTTGDGTNIAGSNLIFDYIIS